MTPSLLRYRYRAGIICIGLNGRLRQLTTSVLDRDKENGYVGRGLRGVVHKSDGVE